MVAGAAAAVAATTIPKAYYALFGASIGSGLLASQGPIVYRYAHSRYYNWKYYWKRFSYNQNPELNVSILGYIYQNQKQITGNSQICKFSFNENEKPKNCVIKLPLFNKNYPFKTKWGIIYIRLITLDGLNIAGFELAVVKRSITSFWFKQKKQINFLDFYIKLLCDQVNIPFVGDPSNEPNINKKCEKYLTELKEETNKTNKTNKSNNLNNPNKLNNNKNDEDSVSIKSDNETVKIDNDKKTE
jgi:hypothetical protein